VVSAPVDADGADTQQPGEAVAARAVRLAVECLQGYASVKTRNAYARDLGLPAEVRAALPGGPRNPAPPEDTAWIPWALARGVDPAGELTPEIVRAWVHTLQAAGAGKNVRRRRFAALLAFYRHLRVAKVVHCDPNNLINRKTMHLSGTDPSSTKPVTAAQVRALHLAAALDTTRSRERSQAMVAVISAAAPRVEEFVGLDLEDYQRVSPTGHGFLTLDGKGDKKRVQLLPPADCDLLDTYLQVRVAPDAGTEVTVAGQVSNRSPVAQPLFTSDCGTRLHVNSVTHILRRLAKLPQLDDSRAVVRAAARELAPIKDTLHPHQFRHGYASLAAENGVPLHHIQADLGHASLTTTQTYLHISDRAKNSAAAKVSGIYHAGVQQDIAATDTTEEDMVPSFDTTEKVHTFTHPDGHVYEVDDLGITHPDQAGTYAIYREGDMVCEFEPGTAEPTVEQLEAAAIQALEEVDSDA
jgi:integrase/recombinase XerD